VGTEVTVRDPRTEKQGDAMEQAGQNLRLTYRLLDRVRSGDEAAASELLDRYLGRVIAMVRSWLAEPLRGRLETMDLVQEALLAAWKKLAAFEPRGSGAFYAWLRQIVHHKVQEAAKREVADARDPRREIPLEPGHDEEDRAAGEWLVAATHPHLSTFVDRLAAVEKLEAHLKELGEDQRQALTLWYIEGLTPTQMAEQLGRSADACRMLVGRALKRLGSRFREARDVHGA
jgi:RNA polymerase sigma-70 factor, ECF subfamily